MTIRIQWFDRNQDDYSPNYSNMHTGTISGKDADDVWKKFCEYRRNHNLAKYTRGEIIGMWE